MKHEAKSHILNHDNIVKLYAMVFEEGHYGVVLEYVHHGDLEKFVFQYQVSLDSLRHKKPFCGRAPSASGPVWGAASPPKLDFWGSVMGKNEIE